LGGAAAAEGQGALNELEIDHSSSCFSCARSRLARIIKGAKKAAFYPELRRSSQSLARRFASLLLLPAASSCDEVLMVSQLDKAGAASAEAYAPRPDGRFCPAAPRFSIL
jgi:hypothetical protein